MGAFDQNWLFLRHPNGGVEDLAAMQAAGFGGVAVNIGDHDPSTWEQIVRPRALSLGMWCGPWLHTRNSEGTFASDRLDALIACADRWASPLVVNSEKEIDGTGAACTSEIAAKVGTRDAAISMEAWLFNPPSVDWTPVAHLPMCLQIFPEQPDWPSNNPAGCKQHAHECGIRCVYFTFGAYGNFQPTQYDLQTPYSCYSADDMGLFYAAWAPMGSNFVACIEEPKPPDPEPEPPPNGGEAVGIGAAQSCRDAWEAFKTASSLDAWRRDNPGEWQALQSYWIAEAGTGPPQIQSKTGLGLLGIVEARRYAEGTHA